MKEEILERKPDGNGAGGKTQKGLEFRRYFTREGISPYDTVEWEYRTAAITNESGEVIFEQKNVEIPKSWSMTATNIVAPAANPRRRRCRASCREIRSTTRTLAAGFLYREPEISPSAPFVMRSALHIAAASLFFVRVRFCDEFRERSVHLDIM